VDLLIFNNSTPLTLSKGEREKGGVKKSKKSFYKKTPFLKMASENI